MEALATGKLADRRAKRANRGRVQMARGARGKSERIWPAVPHHPAGAHRSHTCPRIAHVVNPLRAPTHARQHVHGLAGGVELESLVSEQPPASSLRCARALRAGEKWRGGGKAATPPAVAIELDSMRCSTCACDKCTASRRSANHLPILEKKSPALISNASKQRPAVSCAPLN
jgi:hypothetical protein